MFLKNPSSVYKSISSKLMAVVAKTITLFLSLLSNVDHTYNRLDQWFLTFSSIFLEDLRENWID